MDPREKLRQYIASAGGYVKASDIRDCAEITLRSVMNGWRGVSKNRAAMWQAATEAHQKNRAAIGKKANPRMMLRADEIVWIRATKQAPGAAKPRKARAGGRK